MTTIVTTARHCLRPVKRAYRSTLVSVLRPFMLSTTAAVGDNRFQVPLIRGVGLENRWGTELWMTDLLRRLLQFTGSAGLIDVGVNIGQTLLKLKGIDLKLKYFGFEPNPFCVLYANELVRRNGLESSCAIFPVALSDAPALLDFIAESEADSGATMLADLRPGLHAFRKQYIAALAFDDMNIEVDDITMVKIDVEGAELRVLLGMTRFVQRVRPFIICEVLHAHCESKLPDLTLRNGAIIKLLEELRYCTFRLIKGQARVEALEPVTSFPDAIWNKTSSGLCDYLLAPDERSNAFASTFA
jgi:FkbM family methyltransferase